MYLCLIGGIVLAQPLLHRVQGLGIGGAHLLLRIPVGQRLGEEIIQLHQHLDVGAGHWGPICRLQRLLQLLVQLVKESLDRIPVIDVHLVLQSTVKGCQLELWAKNRS